MQSRIKAKKIVHKIHVDGFTLLYGLRYYMFCWHSILRLQTKGNFVEHYPVVWSIRETSQASSSKVSLELFWLPKSIAVLRSVLVFRTLSCYEHWVIFWRYSVGRAAMKCKLGAVPIAILKAHVTLIDGSVPAKCAWLQSFSWIVVSIFRIFQSRFTEIEIDTFDA